MCPYWTSVSRPSRLTSLSHGMLPPPPAGIFNLVKMALRSASLMTGSVQVCEPPVWSTQVVSRARCRIGYTSLVYDVVVGVVRRPPLTIVWKMRSYSVMTLSRSGANFDGVRITHAPRTVGVELSARSLIVADTGPSETSSYQSSLAQKNPSRAVPAGEADVPKPPSTTRWFSGVLRISPSGTVVTGALENLIVPVS